VCADKSENRERIWMKIVLVDCCWDKKDANDRDHVPDRDLDYRTNPDFCVAGSPCLL